MIATAVQDCKIFIGRELGHHWPKLQFVFDVVLTNKDRTQSLSEFAVVPPAKWSQVQVMCGEEETDHRFCSLKNPTKSQ